MKDQSKKPFNKAGKASILITTEDFVWQNREPFSQKLLKDQN